MLRRSALVATLSCAALAAIVVRDVRVADATPAHAPAARYAIAYRLGITEPAAHLYTVEMEVGNLGAASRGVLDLQMPVWSPGRYARFDFAKNVQGFQARAASGDTLRWDKTGGSRWRVWTKGSPRVTLRYQVYANNLSGTFSVLDTAHANWNGASLFMYVDGHKPDPVTLHVDAPAGWQLMNGDASDVGQRDFRFENYDRLIDTPTEVAPSLMLDSFNVDGIVYRTMVHYNGTPPAGARQRFVRDVERIVRYENTVVAPPPLKRYTFLFNVGYAGGDGMEHLYSTQIIGSSPWSDTATVLTGVATAAHEYFHTWNVKRVRPMALGPFDYTQAQHQPSLWVAEGWTQYFGTVGLHRAGIVDRAALYAAVANGIVRPNLTAPGRLEVSARQASFQAPFFDGLQVMGQETNARNSFFSYYTKGAGLAMTLDLMIRAASDNHRALDDALRNLKRLSWDQPNASYYLQGRGYTEADVERAVSQAMGRDMHPFFEQHVGGKIDPPLDSALAGAGLRFVRGDTPTTPWRIEEIPGATAAQLRVREGWITGKVDR